MLPFLGPLERLRLVRDGSFAADSRTRRRAAMILSLDRGTPPVEVARAAGCSRTTVYDWLRRYLEHRDPGSLRGRKSGGPGRPPGRSAASRVSALVGGAGPHLGGLGRHGPRIEEARRLQASSDRSAGLRGEVLLAMDRGASVAEVSRASGRSRQAIHRAWADLVRGRGGS